MEVIYVAVKREDLV